MANRETRRREKKKKEYIIETSSEESLSKLIKIGLIVGVVLVIFYVITALITGDLKSNKKQAEDDDGIVSIQYDEILAGETFNMKNDKYFVLFYDFSDASASLYNTLINKYQSGAASIKVYTADLSKGFNNSYISETSNPNVNNIKDLKINGPTIIKIENNTNVSYGEGLDAIKNILK